MPDLSASRLAVAKVYIVTFRSRDEKRPSKFIVLTDGRKEAIEMGREDSGTGFSITIRQVDSTGQEMKAGALRVL